MQIFKRVIKGGITGFYRNKTISASSIFILVITLFIISSLFLFKKVFVTSIEQIKSKVDISIYIKPEAAEDSIVRIRELLQNMPEVQNVNYISKEDTLVKFKEDYKDDESTLAALSEISNNPFGASFSIQAKDTNDYGNIVKKINQDKILGQDEANIDKINYIDIQDSIAKLNNTVVFMESVGLLVAVVFIIMTILIVYNTIRLAIFTFRDEISIMKLVGASNMYIRGPFIVEGALYGVCASFIVSVVLYPIAKTLTNKTQGFLSGFNIFEYYKENIFNLFLLLCLIGVTLSVISAMLAVRKYLKN